MGLHSEYVDEFCREVEVEHKEGYAPIGRQGIHEAILRLKPVSEFGRVLGFEPLVSNQTLSCSWLCNGLETVVAEKLKILPNANGLIGTFEDAKKAIAYIERDDVGAEPGLWLPWLIVEHPAETNDD